MAWQATKNSKIRSFWSISASHNLEYSSRKMSVGAVCLHSRGKESGNFASFGQGKPGKVREFHFAEVLTTMNIVKYRRISTYRRISSDIDKISSNIIKYRRKVSSSIVEYRQISLDIDISSNIVQYRENIVEYRRISGKYCQISSNIVEYRENIVKYRRISSRRYLTIYHDTWRYTCRGGPLILWLYMDLVQKYSFENYFINIWTFFGFVFLSYLSWRIRQFYYYVFILG